MRLRSLIKCVINLEWMSDGGQNAGERAHRYFGLAL
jgi:hypothetical protein